MPWQVPHSDPRSVPQLPAVLNLGAMRSDAELQQVGVLSLGSLAIPPMQGVQTSTSQGDTVRALVQEGDYSSGFRSVERLAVDISGQGQGSLVLLGGGGVLTNTGPLSLGAPDYQAKAPSNPDTTVATGIVYFDPSVGQATVSTETSVTGDPTETQIDYVTATVPVPEGPAGG